MIAIATQSEALTTMPAMLAARWPGRWRSCAIASEATGDAGATRVRTCRREPEGDGRVAPQRQALGRREQQERNADERKGRGPREGSARLLGEVYRAVSQRIRDRHPVHGARDPQGAGNGHRDRDRRDSRQPRRIG